MTDVGAEGLSARLRADPWLAALVDGAFDAIISKDSGGIVLSWNAAAERIYGYSAAEAVGRHISFIVPDDRCAEIADIMARLARGDLVAPFETVRRHKDGRLLDMLVTVMPVRDETGRIIAAWKMAQDQTEQKRAIKALEAGTATLDVVMNTVPAAIWLAHDAEARRMTGSRYATEKLRTAQDANLSLSAPDAERPRHFRIRRNGVELPPSELPVQRAARGEEVRGEELEVLFEDGSTMWEFANASPIRNARGEVVGAVGAAVDLTERKRDEERQKLLMGELDHRVKNALATVQSIILQSLGRSDEAEQLSGRIQALAATHALLSESRWRGVRLNDLVDQELRVYRDPADLRGPGVVLAPMAAQTLGLVLHELTTNAAKYGALSVPEGGVSVEWRVVPGEPACLHLDWREHGGPRVVAPTRQGFGCKLIERGFSYGLNGRATLDFAPDGLRCRIELPLGRNGGEGIDLPAVPAPVPEPLPSAKCLRGRRILVAEDEVLVALEVEQALRDAGAEPLGPYATVAAALAAAEGSLDAAVLDVNLQGEIAAPVAARLRARGLPFLFMTGYGRLDLLPAELRGAPTLRKPVQREALIRRLAAMLN